MFLGMDGGEWLQLGVQVLVLAVTAAGACWKAVGGKFEDAADDRAEIAENARAGRERIWNEIRTQNGRLDKAETKIGVHSDRWERLFAKQALEKKE